MIALTEKNPFCVEPYKRILQTGKAFHRTERLFLSIFVLETMKKGTISIS